MITLPKLSWIALVALTLTTACSTQKSSHAQWDGMTGSSNVAKVSNIQSLITPGFN